jgi:hypothetical protein
MPCDARLMIFLATVSTSGSSGSLIFKMARALSNAVLVRASVPGSIDAAGMYFVMGFHAGADPGAVYDSDLKSTSGSLRRVFASPRFGRLLRLVNNSRQ